MDPEYLAQLRASATYADTFDGSQVRFRTIEHGAATSVLVATTPQLEGIGGRSLHPQTVIAGHQRAGRHDGPEILEETRQYIRDFDHIAETTSTAEELYDQILALYPDRINPDVVWISAQAVKQSRSDEQ
jgi:hypothetical protein